MTPDKTSHYHLIESEAKIAMDTEIEFLEEPTSVFSIGSAGFADLLKQSSDNAIAFFGAAKRLVEAVDAARKTIAHTIGVPGENAKIAFYRFLEIAEAIQARCDSTVEMINEARNRADISEFVRLGGDSSTVAIWAQNVENVIVKLEQQVKYLKSKVGALPSTVKSGLGVVYFESQLKTIKKRRQILENKFKSLKRTVDNMLSLIYPRTTPNKEEKHFAREASTGVDKCMSVLPVLRFPELPADRCRCAS